MGVVVCNAKEQAALPIALLTQQRGADTGLHRDVDATALIVLRGVKTIMFHPPGNRLAGVDDDILKDFGESLPYLFDDDSVSAFDLPQEDAEKWIKVRAEAGTIVSIPKLWWHHAITQEDCLSVIVAVVPIEAVNVRLGPGFDVRDHFVPSDEAYKFVRGQHARAEGCVRISLTFSGMGEVGEDEGWGGGGGPPPPPPPPSFMAPSARADDGRAAADVADRLGAQGRCAHA